MNRNSLRVLFALALTTTICPAQEALDAPPVAEFGADKLMSGLIPSSGEQYKGVVKVEADSQNPNYALPWQSGNFSAGIGSAFLIGRGQFLTNAHVVSNAERINILQYGSSRKIPAKVKYIAHDADLALLEISDKDFEAFGEQPYFDFCKGLPQLEDEVRALGYPMGGSRLSVTRGVVSRIDFINYSHPKTAQHLAIQIDAAINPGNSGGPVVMGNKVIGVAFQGISGANSTGYVIPVPVIRHFLDDVKDGKYDQYTDLGVQTFRIANPAMRQALNLPDNELGVLVSHVTPGGSSDGVLQAGDVILSIDGYDVDSSGMVRLNGETVSMNELIERLFRGDKVAMKIQRDGKQQKATVTLEPSRGKTIMAAEYDKKPRYVVCAGYVFQPLQRDVLISQQIPMADIALNLRDFTENGGASQKEDVVLLTHVLKDEINSKMQNAGSSPVVSKVNGVEVKGLRHLYELLYDTDPQASPFITIELKNSGRPIVIRRKDLDAANQRISRQYNISNIACLDSQIDSNNQQH